MAWCGLLEVTPSTDIPDGTTRDRIAKYPVRVHVRPLIVLPVFKAISITEEPVWNALSLTKGKTRSPGWNAAFRSDLAGLSEQDGEYLVHAIQARYGAPIGPKAAADDPPYTPSTEDDRERVDFRVELTRVFH